MVVVDNGQIEVERMDTARFGSRKPSFQVRVSQEFYNELERLRRERFVSTAEASDIVLQRLQGVGGIAGAGDKQIARGLGGAEDEIGNLVKELEERVNSLKESQENLQREMESLATKRETSSKSSDSEVVKKLQGQSEMIKELQGQVDRLEARREYDHEHPEIRQALKEVAKLKKSYDGIERGSDLVELHERIEEVEKVHKDLKISDHARLNKMWKLAHTHTFLGGSIPIEEVPEDK